VKLPRSCACGRIVAKGATCPCGGSSGRRRASTTERGYGTAWQRLSAQVIAEEGACIDCGWVGSVGNPLTADHRTPKSSGGSDSRSNLVCRCRRCNSAKGASAGLRASSLDAGEDLGPPTVEPFVF
jgi:5-methylcytosine-specific restriction endonuclease McrA